MDSITQAALGALCGEIILSRKLGWKGAALGAAFGTLPDLDVIAFYWLDAAEQLRWHRGITHSIFVLPFVSLFFGWLLTKIFKNKKLTFKRAFWFVFAAWSTHIFIDCFNSYGTHIFEPFSDHRFALNVMFVIDPFFTVPMLLGLLLCLTVWRKKEKLRVGTQWVTVACISLYFVASVVLKFMADRYFSERFNQWGVTPKAVMSAPTPFNIFCWRGVAKDDEKYYVSYWSLFDGAERKDKVLEFAHGRELEKDFRDSKDFQAIKWFSKGWRKTFQVEGEPESIYIAAIMMGEMHSEQDDKIVYKPPFVWKITKKGDSYKLERPFKMSKDVWGRLAEAKKSIIRLNSRVKGDALDWTEGTWIWDLNPPKPEWQKKK